MILLVDSGSTKADWTAVDNNGGTLFSTATLGLNPSVLSGDEIIERISTNESISTNKKNIELVKNFYRYRFKVFDK